MKKIILPINAIQPDKNSLEFAAYLGRLTNSKITGIFLENLLQEGTSNLPVNEISYLDQGIKENSEEQISKAALIEKNISSYKESCKNLGINFIFHRDRGFPVHSLITESRYADLMVVDAATSFHKLFEGTPTDFVKDILKKTECPVIVAPEDFRTIEEIIFTYDDTASSLFAIKQFTYLFPQLHNKKINVIHIDEAGEWNNPNLHKLKELLNNHYFDLHFEVLQGNIYNSLFEFVLKKYNALIVMGAYGRNALSRYFKPSHADLVIKNLTQPVFVAHL